MEQKLQGTHKKEKVKDILNRHYDDKIVKPMNERLDFIETFCKEQIKKIQDQNKAVQGFIMQEVKYTIANQLHNADLTMTAWEKVLMKEGLKIENLEQKINDAKKEIQAERTVVAEKRIAEQTSGQEQMVNPAKTA